MEKDAQVPYLGLLTSEVGGSCWLVGGVPVLRMVSTEGAPLLPGGDENLGFLVGLFWNTPVGDFFSTPLIASQGWRSRLSTVLWMGLSPQFFLWCLVEVEWLLSKSFLSSEFAPFLSLD